MSLDNISHVAYPEIAASLGVSIDHVKGKYVVSRRINNLKSLLKFLTTNIDFEPATGPRELVVTRTNGTTTTELVGDEIITKRTPGLITVDLIDVNTSQLLDYWVFPCGKKNATISDQLDTYYTYKSLCAPRKYKTGESILNIYRIVCKQAGYQTQKFKDIVSMFMSSALLANKLDQNKLEMHVTKNKKGINQIELKQNDCTINLYRQNQPFHHPSIEFNTVQVHRKTIHITKYAYA